jgi:hypothetical protein
MYPTSIQHDASNNTWIGGTFKGSVDFDPGTATQQRASVFGTIDGFIAKYDAAGNFLFMIPIASSSNTVDIITNIIVDAAGNVIVAGGYQGLLDFDPSTATATLNAGSGSAAFLAKYDANGNYVDAVNITTGGGGAAATALNMDASGNLYIGGYFSGTPDFDPGAASMPLSTASGSGTSLFFAKYTSAWGYILAKEICNAGIRGLKSIAVDASSNIYIAGYMRGSGDFDPSAGTATLTAGSTEDDLFFAKYSSTGAYVYAKLLSDALNDVRANSITVDASGNAYITGYFRGTVDFDPGAGTSNLVSSSQTIFFAKYNSSGAYVFAKQISTTSGTGWEMGNQILLDGSNNIYIVGAFTGTADFDPGAGTVNLVSSIADIFFAKYDNSGNYLFAKHMAPTSNSYEQGAAITLDASNNIYITGYFSGTVDFDPDATTSNLSDPSQWNGFIGKYNSLGAYVSAQALDAVAGGGANGTDKATCLTRDAAGNTYVAGTFTGSLNFGGDLGFVTQSGIGTSGFFAKYNSAGICQFAKVIGTSVVPTAIARDAANNIYVTGTFTGTPDFDPATAVVNITAASIDAFIGKYDVNGNYVFVKQITGAGTETSNTISIDVSGNIYAGGNFSGTSDFDPSPGTAYLVSNAGTNDAYFAKYSNVGNLTYVKQLGGSGDDYCSSLTLDASNNLILTGSFSASADFDPNSGTSNLTSAGGSDVYFGKYSNSGTLIFVKQISGSANELGKQLKVDNSGNIYITGSFSGTADFNPSSSTANLTSVSGSSAFFAKYTSTGNYSYANPIAGTISNSLSVDGSGNVNLTGTFSGTVDFDPSGSSNFYLVSNNATSDVFIARYNSTGDIIFAKSIGSAGTDEGNAIYTDNSGVVTYVGSFEGTTDFDPDNFTQTNLTAGTNSDLFVSQFQQSFFTITTTLVNGSVSCYGDTDGSAYVTPNGNQPPYTYLWSPSGITDSLATNLEGGTHTVTVTDNFGLTVSQTITIAQPSAPLAATLLSQSNVTCFGGSNGFASIGVTGGTPPYTYSWSPSGGSSNSSSTLTANSYTVTVTDSKGCQSTVPFVISQPSQLNISVSSQLNVSCFGGNNGSASVTATGGSGGNSFSWAPIGTTGTLASNLSAATYTVTVNDLNGCLAQTLVTITQPPVLSGVVSSVVNVTCASSSDGSASVSASGGTAPYTYNWSPTGGTNSSANNLAVGSYTVTVTDNKGCTKTIPVSILNLIPLQEICVVTADSATGNYNIVVWEKPADVSNIDSFVIYREITLGNYQQIGAVHRDSLSLYNDFSANPNSTNYKYKVKVLDTCGSIGNFGLYHNSIHLQYLSFGNFQWTFYEIENTANQVASYNFYRDDNATGNFVLLQIIPGSNNSFTDVNYASYPNARYRVDVNWLSGNICNPTRATVNTTRSNIKNSGFATDYDELNVLSDLISVSPNPADDLLNVLLPDLKSKYTITIYNSLGQKVSERLEIEPGNNVLDLTSLSKGLYSLCIETTKSKVYKKVVIQ